MIILTNPNIKACTLIILLLIIAMLVTLHYADQIDETPTATTQDIIVPDEPEIPSPEPTKMIAEATAYTMEQGSGTGLTSTGTVPMAGRTIATDHSVIPPGTEVLIDGEGPYIVEDQGGDIRGNRIDIYFGEGPAAVSRAFEFGRREVEVTINATGRN